MYMYFLVILIFYLNNFRDNNISNKFDFTFWFLQTNNIDTLESNCRKSIMEIAILLPLILETY